MTSWTRVSSNDHQTTAPHCRVHLRTSSKIKHRHQSMTSCVLSAVQSLFTTSFAVILDYLSKFEQKGFKRNVCSFTRADLQYFIPPVLIRFMDKTLFHIQLQNNFVTVKPRSHQLQVAATVAKGYQVTLHNWKCFYFYCNGLRQLLVAADSQLV